MSKVFIGDIVNRWVGRVARPGVVVVGDRDYQLMQEGKAFAGHVAAAAVSASASVDYLIRAAGTAYAFLTAGDNPAEDETITIGGIVYTFKAAPAAPYDVDIGGSASVTLDNLIAAITFDDGAGTGEGTTYGTGTEAHPDVTAVAWTGDVVKVRALVSGTAGNVIALAADGDNGWTDEAGGDPATFLAGGVDQVQTYLKVSWISSAASIRARLYEGPTVNADGTAVSLANRNRRGTVPDPTVGTAQAEVFSAPTAADDGTLIDNRLFQLGLGGLPEFILAPGQQYLLRLTNEDGSAQDLEASIDILEDSEEIPG